MNGYLFQKSLQVMALFVIFVCALFFMLGREIYDQYSTQKGFQTEYGADWKEQFAKRFGPDGLEQSKKKMIVAAAAIPFFMVFIGLFLKVLMGNKSGGGSSPGRHRKHRRRKNEW